MKEQIDTMNDIMGNNIKKEKFANNQTTAVKPINDVGMIDEFLRKKEIEEKYYIPFVNKINSNGHFLEFRIKLKELNTSLIDLFRKDSRKFIDSFKCSLFERLKFDIEIKEMIKKLEIQYEDLHIIPDPEDLDILIPEIDNLSINLTRYVGKLIRIVGRSQSAGLETSVEWKKLVFECELCGTEFEIPVTYILGEKYHFPRFCINPKCKAKNKSDFKFIEIKSESFETRYITIADLDIRNSPNEMKGFIMKNTEYFIEKAKEIDIEGDVEILGFLRRDYSDLLRFSKEEQHFKYYVEVLDMKTRKSKKIDPDLIEQIKEKIKKNPNYPEELIDSIHDYSSKIYEYFIVKLLFSLTVISSDSWWVNGIRKRKRDSINIIVGGHTGTQKTSIARAFQEILGETNFGIIDETTKVGLLPTIQRSNQKDKDLIKRYGALRYYNKRTGGIDEAENLTYETWYPHKFLGNGRVTRTMDGDKISVPCEGSWYLLLNYKENENECYDYSKSLPENLGYIVVKAPSILERFDCHYAIPNISEIVENVFTKRDFDSEKSKSDNEIFNYLMYAKSIYPDIKLSDELKKFVLKFNNLLSKTDMKTIRTPRNKQIVTKLLKGIAALKFKTIADDDDLEFMKKHLINTLIPYYNNPNIKNIRTIDMNEIFQKTFFLLAELKDEISISEHIEFIREFLENHYFIKSDADEILGVDDREIDIDTYMPEKFNLKDNNKYRDLMEDQGNIKYYNNIGYAKSIIKNKTCYLNEKAIEKGDLKEDSEEIKDTKTDKDTEKLYVDVLLSGQPRSKINKLTSLMDRLKELFEENNWKPLEKKNIIQILELKGIEKEFVKTSLEALINEGSLYEPKPEYLKFTNKED